MAVTPINPGESQSSIDPLRKLAVLLSAADAIVKELRAHRPERTAALSEEERLFIETVTATRQAPTDAPPPATARAEIHQGVPLDQVSIEQIDQRRLSDLFEEFEAAKSAITKRQWQAVCLYYRDGMTESEAATKLGVSRNAIANRLSRARRRKEKHQHARRAERLGLLRKHVNF